MSILPPGHPVPGAQERFNVKGREEAPKVGARVVSRSFASDSLQPHGL